MSGVPLWIRNLFDAVGGVVAKVYNNGSAVAPDTTTSQVILDFTGASTTYTPPGVGESLGTLHVPLDTGGTVFTPDTPLSLVAGHLAIGAATTGSRGTMSASDKVKLNGIPSANLVDFGKLLTPSDTVVDVYDLVLPSDVGIVISTDTRLTNARTPTAHATTHVTGGTDVIANAVAGGASGLMSGAAATAISVLTGTPADARIGGTDSVGLGVGSPPQDILTSTGTSVDQNVNFDRMQFQRTTGNNGVFEVIWRESFWTASGTNYDRTLTETIWYGDGTTDTTLYSHSVVVEVEIIGRTNFGNSYRIAYQGLLQKGTLSDHLSWTTAQGLEENTALRSPLAFDPATHGTCNASMSLSGTHNGNVTFRFSPTGGDSAGNFNIKIRMFGGGKYA